MSKLTNNRIWPYIQLTRMDRPIGWLLLMWPTLWALWIAGEGRPDPTIVIIFLLGVIIMRAAGCIVNDIADSDFDKHVQRTENRPLASGKISKKQAWWLFFVLGLIAFVIVLQLDWLTIKLSFAALFIAVTYPLMKRITHLPQVYLGVAFSWGIPMAFSALTGKVPMLAWALLFANLLWTVAYDTFYAMSDRPDDLKIGIKSTAILFGRFDLHLVAGFYVAFFTMMSGLGVFLKLGEFYFLSIGIAVVIAILLLLQCAERDRLECFKAFVNNSWIGGVLFAGIILSYI